MDAQSPDRAAEDLAAVEAELGHLRAALTDAQAATMTAERAVVRVQAAYDAERRRLEDTKRDAEDALRVLDGKLRVLVEDPEETKASVDRRDVATTADERLVSVLPSDDEDTTAAYEQDWYRSLVKRAERSQAVEYRPRVLPPVEGHHQR